MRKYAVIGDPIAHSFSPEYFNNKFANLLLDSHSYAAIQVRRLKDLPELVDQRGLSGFNVTIPYKQSIIPYLDTLSHSAAAIGAVNTVEIDNYGRWHGHNTDFFGFRESLLQHVTTSHRRALIFGTGGSSRAIRYALRQMGIAYTFVSRNPEKGMSYSELTIDTIQMNKLLINTTPLGMSPNEDSVVSIPFGGISEHHICYDLIYNPQKTLFLVKGEEQGAKVMNGLKMLHLQADKAWDIWRK